MEEINNLEINYNTVKKAEILVSTSVNTLLGNASNNIVIASGVLITLSSSVLYNRYNDLEQITKEDFESKKNLLEQKVLTK